jgi:S-adenosylmethionine hydrolase
MAAPIITFLSDFGHDDWFVGVVHGVLHAVCPEAAVVDITHAVPPGDVARGGFVLAAAAPDFPPGTVHLGVVDPGVGTDRRAIAVKARDQLFVGPDNGLLEWAVSDPHAEIRSLIERRYFRSPMSRTFHGRDVFAPVAGHLARGEPIACFGPELSDPVRQPLPAPERRGGELIGRVVFVDRFGNVLTNVAEQDLSDGFPMVPEDRLEVVMLGRTIHGLSRSYGEGPVGTILAIIGSSGRLEIAQVGGDASERLGLGEGDQIRVRAG